MKITLKDMDFIDYEVSTEINANGNDFIRILPCKEDICLYKNSCLELAKVLIFMAEQI